MPWPYKIASLSPAEKQERHLLLHQYGRYAQFSLLGLLAFLIVAKLTLRFVRRITGRGLSYVTVPASSTPRRRQGYFAKSVSTAWRRCLWWFGNEVEILGFQLGYRDQLIFGTLWLVWSLFLCFRHTQHDYSHLTKRFGVVGTSQLPVQYLLATKRLNPIAYAFGTSHEHINRWHRVLGYITTLLIFCHGVLYLNYYVQVGGLASAFFRRVPVLGMLGLLSMMLLSMTTLSTIRRYSYRVFLITHITIAVGMPLVIWFHTKHARSFVATSVLIFLADWAARRLSTVECPATIEKIASTDLIKVVARIPEKRFTKFIENPASYAFLSLPLWHASGTRQSHLTLSTLGAGLTSNPFTAASVHEETNRITFIVRHRQGPVTNELARLASLQPASASSKISINGPYGSMTSFQRLAGPYFDSILLVAGGVGATFTTALYKHIMAEKPPVNVRLVWAARDQNEFLWPRAEEVFPDMYNNSNIDLFVTGDLKQETKNAMPAVLEASADIELSDHGKIAEGGFDSSTSLATFERPDLTEIVNQVFQDSPHGRIAVVVCGPTPMARKLRTAVGAWVNLGRDVWFHSESFDW